ncbi:MULTISPECIES: hypothetical protein [Aeromonas]|nr:MULTISPECIES: hypothetical protein [Aeromonas]MCR3939953.1 hypothetical protein [Aeromonas caviae]MCR3948959.1 hypothetical protein [Aeromonas caviae]
MAQSRGGLKLFEMATGLTLLCMLVLGWGLRVLLASASRRRLKED